MLLLQRNLWHLFLNIVWSGHVKNKSNVLWIKDVSAFKSCVEYVYSPFFQRCGEISFDSPEQNARCVRMLGKCHPFSYKLGFVIRWNTIKWASVTYLRISAFLMRLVGSHNSSGCIVACSITDTDTNNEYTSIIDYIKFTAYLQWFLTIGYETWMNVVSWALPVCHRARFILGLALPGDIYPSH